jgi:signal transduction histidine kinase
MRATRWWRSPYVAHAARVAGVATIIIMAVYVCVCAGFDTVDRQRLAAQIDTKLQLRLGEMVTNPSAAASLATNENAHDADDAPVFAWTVDRSGISRTLTPGAPALPASTWSPGHQSAAARLGGRDFELVAARVGETWIVAGQSLVETNHVGSDLIALEAIAGPVLLIAVFSGTMVIGVKAAGPVELSRRRQLEFTADASHELRTPLSVIEAEVSLGLTGRRTVDDYRDTLGRVSREALRLRHIVEDLLWLSRFDSEPPPPGDEPLDVSAVAVACADRFDGIAQQRGISLSVLTQGQGRPWINAPPEWVDRLTAVLVDNACRYAGDGGMVVITVGAQGNWVCLAVDDNGPGIAAEERAALFDRFHRATDEGNGAGLGLAIGDAVVRATGGEWHVETSEMGGARMEVRWHRSHGTPEISDPTEHAYMPAGRDPAEELLPPLDAEHSPHAR